MPGTMLDGGSTEGNKTSSPFLNGAYSGAEVKTTKHDQLFWGSRAYYSSTWKGQLM